MPSSPQRDTLRIQRGTSATREEAWALIADITRMGDWSPETTSAVWRGGATGPALGARFRGAATDSGVPRTPDTSWRPQQRWSWDP
jgi:hypothetical protein